ncbi:hypothetical protein K1720_07605 [Thermococcus argininiproducens]|uniref:Uncharacterized protein n=1 Tax=Thermococcus argininiproducens TaxID=2866384 RepID=A0A9E7M958_9EURY|nr:hypothetical protein [Thermococcus argininiproducens]USG99390.1 hypothetical protein K1720_07605 [Thermococcus argininiproducens]
MKEIKKILGIISILFFVSAIVIISGCTNTTSPTAVTKTFTETKTETKTETNTELQSQVESLLEQVQKLEEEKKNLTFQISELETEINELKKVIDEKNTVISAMNKTLLEKEEELRSLKNIREMHNATINGYTYFKSGMSLMMAGTLYLNDALHLTENGEFEKAKNFVRNATEYFQKARENFIQAKEYFERGKQYANLSEDIRRIGTMSILSSELANDMESYLTACSNLETALDKFIEGDYYNGQSYFEKAVEFILELKEGWN